tara:strand:- start:5308 stop:5700 length:393 start_codon:yes stop_codon:yes gene_type:complete
MAKFSTIRRLVVEDYPKEVRPWLNKMIYILNPFLEQVYTALVNGLTLKDNSKGDVISLIIYAGETDKLLKWDLNEKPSSVTIGQITLTNGAHPTNQITMTWLYTQSNQLDIKFNGLNASNEYRVTLIGQV